MGSQDGTIPPTDVQDEVTVMVTGFAVSVLSYVLDGVTRATSSKRPMNLGRKQFDKQHEFASKNHDESHVYNLRDSN